MKNIYIFTALAFMNWGLAQQFSPVFEKNFNSITSDSHFTVGTSGVTQSTDYYYNNLSAAKFIGDSKGVQLDFASQPTLETEGTVEFFYLHSSLWTEAYNNIYPIFYMPHGGNSSTINLFSALFAANSSNVYTMAASSQQPSGPSSQISTIFNDKPLIKEKWHHYLISYKFGTGGYLRVYRNGILLLQNTVNFTNTSTPKKMYFLSHVNNTNSNLTTSTAGQIDDIKVYTQSFSTTQVIDRFKEVSKIIKGTSTVKYKFNNNLTDFFGGPNLATTGGNGTTYSQNFNGTNNTVLNVNPNTTSSSYPNSPFYGQIPQSLNTHLGSNYTISFAYKSYTNMNDNNGSDVVPIIYIPTVESTKPMIIGVRKNSNSTLLPICVKMGTNRWDSNVTINSGDWGHATVVVDNNNLSLYFNGERILNNINITANSKQPSSTSPILVGKSESPLDLFRGYIDDLVIDNKSYTAADARALYAHWVIQDESFATNSSLSTTDVKEVGKGIKIAPNPTSDFISLLNVTDASNVKIYSSTGQIVITTKNIKNIDVRNLSNGNYFIQIEEPNKRITVKQFIKN